MISKLYITQVQETRCFICAKAFYDTEYICRLSKRLILRRDTLGVGIESLQKSLTRFGKQYFSLWSSLMAQQVKNLPVMQETQEIRVQSLGQEYSLEEKIAIHSSVLAQETHGQKRLIGYSPWGCKEQDTNEHTHTHAGFLSLYQAPAAAAANSLQSYPILCDPIDGSPGTPWEQDYFHIFALTGLSLASWFP